MIKMIKISEYNKNILWNYFFRLISMILSLYSVRLYLSYLGEAKYGNWLTILSIISWMNSGDLGIGNGLRNELSKAVGKNDKTLQKLLIKNAFITLCKTILALFFIFLVIGETLIRTGIIEDELRISLFASIIFYGINMILGLFRIIAFSYQKSMLDNVANCFSRLFLIVFVLAVIYFRVAPNLFLFSFFDGFSLMLANLFVFLYLFMKGFLPLDIWRQKRDRNICKRIMNTGIVFFGLQICAIILFSTDNLIINYFFGSEQVTEYGIITKVYETGSELFSVLLISLWSAVTVHFVKKEYGWIKGKLKQLFFLWCFFSVGVVGVSACFNKIVSIWLSDKAITYDNSMIILFGCYCCLTTFTSIFVITINGMGIAKLQLIFAIVEAIVNIPLSIYLAHNCGFGIIGVKLATFICMIPGGFVMPLQVILTLRRKERMEKNDTSI